MLPTANVYLSNGNLGGQAPSEYGVAGVVIASPVAPVAGYSVPFLLLSAKEASVALAQPENAAVLSAIADFFYAEAPVGSKLYAICVAPTMSLTTMAGAPAAALLNYANGAILLMSAIKFPAITYAPAIVEGFDQDVHDAVSAWHTLALAWLAARKPFRTILQGYGFTTAGAARDYSGLLKNTVAVVVGSVNDSTAAATLLALGRAAATDPQRNVGRVKSGSLKLADSAVVKIGAAILENTAYTDLNTLHNKRYMSFVRNEIAPGYIVSDDNMLVGLADDYNSLRYGRIIDVAVRVVYAGYYEELKDDVSVDKTGRLDAVVEKALEAKIESLIDTKQRGQLSLNEDGRSAVEVLVNPDVAGYAALYAKNNITAPNLNILQTSKIYIFVRLRPKASLKYIDVYLGYTVG